MKIKQVIDETGLKEKTIRYYEECGLISPATTRSNGRTYRDYTDEDVKRLKQIVMLRNAGFHIKEIQELENHPERAERIVEEYRSRIVEDADSLKTLQEAMRNFVPENIDSFNEFCSQIQDRLYQVQKRHIKITFNFGEDDRETEEEKQTAIAAFHAKKEPHPLRYIIGALAIINIILLAAVIFLFRERNNVISAGTGSTTEYLYYISGENLTDAAAIYTRKDTSRDMSFVVGPEKIYFIDGTKLYSMNFDGSGLFQFDGTYATTPGGRYARTWPALVLNGDTLYACYAQGGIFGSPTQKIAAISTDSGNINYLSSDYLSSMMGVDQDRLYIYDTYEPYTGFSVIDLKTGEQVFSSELSVYGECVWFYQGRSYISVPTDNGYDLICVTEEIPEGVVVDHCSGWYFGGYENYCICSNGGLTYLVNINDPEEKQRITLRSNLTISHNTVISSDENVVEFVSFP